MTDRLCALTVVLDGTIREDDAERIMDAIGMIKGVAEVRPVVADSQAHWAKTMALRELELKLWNVLKQERER